LNFGLSDPEFSSIFFFKLPDFYICFYFMIKNIDSSMIYLVFYLSPNFLLNLPTNDHLQEKKTIGSCNLVTETSDRTRVNQQPPAQDEAIQAILGMNQKTHPLPLPWDFSAPFFAPKFSPSTYLPPLSYLPHFISHSLHLQSSGELSSLSSIEL
jgi:hypothetical protein